MTNIKLAQQQMRHINLPVITSQPQPIFPHTHMPIWH